MINALAVKSAFIAYAIFGFQGVHLKAMEAEEELHRNLAKRHNLHILLAQT